MPPAAPADRQLFSAYTNAKDTQGCAISLSAIHQRIRTDSALQRQTQALRPLSQDPDQADVYRQQKAALPAFIAGGRFPAGHRKAEDLTKHSGFLILDLDYLDDAHTVRHAAAALPHTALAFISPSGAGVKVLVALNPHPTDARSHTAAWHAVSQYYAVQLAVKPDPSGKDVSRLTFFAHDPDAYMNPAAQPFAWQAVAPPRPAPPRDEAPDPAPPPSAQYTMDEYCNMLDSISPPEAYEEWLKLLTAIKAAGLSQEEAEAWSARGEKHRAGEVAGRWTGLNTTRVTTGTLVRHVKEARWPFPQLTAEPDWALMPHCDAARLIHAHARTLLFVKEERGDYAHPDPAKARLLSLDSNGATWGVEKDRLLHLQIALCRKYRLYIHADKDTSHKDASIADRYLRKVGTQDGLIDTLKHVGAAVLAMKEYNTLPPGLTCCAFGAPDRDKRYLGVVNGVVDLKTGKLLPPAEARKTLVTRSTGVTFDPSARHEHVDGLLAHLDPAAAEYLKRVLGRAVWGNPERGFILLCGPRNGGKTTLLTALQQALGEEAGTVSADAIRPQRRGGKEGPTPERESLVTKRVVTAVEVERWTFDPGRLKALAGGGDFISVQPKYEKERKAQITAAIILAANELPRFGLTDAAVADRLRVVPYPAVPESRKKQAVLQAFKEDGDTHVKRAMLALLVRYAAQNPPGADIPLPEVVQREITAAVSAEQGEFGDWLHHVLIEDGRAKVSVPQIWEAWAAHVGEDDPQQKVIDDVRRQDVPKRVRDLCNLGPATILRIGTQVQRGWSGYRLATPEEYQKRVEAADRPAAKLPIAGLPPALPEEIALALSTAAEEKLDPVGLYDLFAWLKRGGTRYTHTAANGDTYSVAVYPEAARALYQIRQGEMDRLSLSPSDPYDEEGDIFISRPLRSPQVADLEGQADNPTPIPGAFFSLEFRARSCDLDSLEQCGVLGALLLALSDDLRDQLVDAYQRTPAEDPVPPLTPPEWEAHITERKRQLQEVRQREASTIRAALASGKPKGVVATEMGMSQEYLDHFLDTVEDFD